MCAVIYSKSKLASASQICWFNRAKISGVRLTSGKGLQTQKPNDDLKVGYGPDEAFCQRHWAGAG